MINAHCEAAKSEKRGRQPLTSGALNVLLLDGLGETTPDLKSSLPSCISRNVGLWTSDVQPSQDSQTLYFNARRSHLRLTLGLCNSVAFEAAI